MTREEAIKIIDCYDIGFYDLSGEKIPADKLADAFDMAIEALSAEAVTHGRLIDADALSEKLCETTIFIKDGEAFQRMINDAPTVSAETVQGWIPCSERLPEKGELVLVTVWNDVTIAWRNIYGGWDSAEDMYEKGDVIAWMPLPEPYKGGDE